MAMVVARPEEDSTTCLSRLMGQQTLLVGKADLKAEEGVFRASDGL